MTTTPLKTLPGIITEAQNLQPIMCLFGVPGVGKSTTGSQTEDPIFIPLEEGVENIDVHRFPVATTLDQFLENLKAVAHGDHGYKTVVIDTLNRLMDLYHQAKKDIPGEKGKPLYDFVGYGGTSGWTAVAKDIRREVIPLLMTCKRRGMLVLVLAHTGQYTRNNPLGDNMVVSAPSIPKPVWLELHGDFDVIGRADYVYSTSTVSKDRDGRTTKAKASTDEEIVDGARVKARRLTFAGGAEDDCKTRVGYELPATLPLSWAAIRENLGNINKLVAEIRDLWRYLPPDSAAKTLAWLGRSNLDDIAKASRSKLSQLRNRLIELRDEAEAVASMHTTPDA
jgi:hypothetical protein